MKRRDKLLLTGLASATMILSGGALVGNVFAAGSNTDSTGLVAKIAQKFNLKQSDVQAVFDEERATHEAEMQKKNEELLTKAVTDGDLTEAQKTLILAKQKEIKAKMEELRSSNTDPRTTMKEQRSDVEAWAKENTIDLKWLRPLGGHGPGGPGGPRSEKPADATATSAN